MLPKVFHKHAPSRKASRAKDVFSGTLKRQVVDRLKSAMRLETITVS